MEVIDLTRGVILGLIQGLLEWLPISSSGNVFLILAFLGIPAEEAYRYSLFLHLGTVLSALILLWGLFKEKDIVRFTLTGLVVSIAVGGPLYLYFEVFVSSTSLLWIAVVLGFLLIFTGLVERKTWSKNLNVRATRQLSIGDAFIVGVFQGLSVLPGLSRSGLTVAALLWRGFKLQDSFKLSFVSGIPFIIVGEIGLVFFEGSTLFTLEILVGLVVAMVAGLLSLKTLLGVVSEKPFWIVCVTLGIISLLSAPLLL